MINTDSQSAFILLLKGHKKINRTTGVDGDVEIRVIFIVSVKLFFQ